MNSSTFSQAQNAYENKDFAYALDLYNSCANDQNFPLLVGEFGLLYHQIGNCLVKLSNYSDAINAYVSASTDSNYKSLGTVYYNLGMAYVYMNDFGNAIANFQTAVNDPNYLTKYKAYSAMGNALMKNGKPAEAGAAFRKCALDPQNPDPTRALLNLGVCFMALGRPEDAVTVYESAFQFNTSDDIKNRLNSNLGQAYVASGQMQHAVRAFENALYDKKYVLSDSASVDYQRAIAAVSKGADNIDLNKEGRDAALNSGMIPNNFQAGVTEAITGSRESGIVDKNSFNNSSFDNSNASSNRNIFDGDNISNPVDQHMQNQYSDVFDYSGASSSVVDSGPDDVQNINYDGDKNIQSDMSTGQSACNLTKDSNQYSQQTLQNESECDDADQEEFNMWSKSAQEAAYNPQTRKSPTKIILVVILSILVVAIFSTIVLYILGFGIPTQQSVANTLFSNPIEAKDQVFAQNVSDYKKDCYCAMVSQTSNPTVNATDQNMTESCVYMSANNSSGGVVNYKIKMSRDILTWKILSVDLDFASQYE